MNSPRVLGLLVALALAVAPAAAAFCPVDAAARGAVCCCEAPDHGGSCAPEHEGPREQARHCCAPAAPAPAAPVVEGMSGAHALVSADVAGLPVSVKPSSSRWTTAAGTRSPAPPRPLPTILYCTFLC